MERYDVLIIGGGTAGVSAAAAACEAGCRVLLVDRGAVPGGVLLQCGHRGFGAGRTGAEYAAELVKTLPEAVALRLEATVLSVSKEREAVLSSAERGLEKIAFSQLIHAAGCRERPVGALGIAGTRPAGVYTAGEVQALIHLHHTAPEGPVVILGSGDMGLIVARDLIRAGRQVAALVEKKESCGGLAKNRRECVEAYHIPVLCSATVAELQGQGRLTGVLVRQLASGEETLLPCRTLVVAAGLLPDQELVKDLKAQQWLHLCGNCRRVFDMVEAVAADGRKAGLAAAVQARG